MRGQRVTSVLCRQPPRRRGISGVSLLMAVIVGLGLYVAFRQLAPLLQGSDCTAAGGGQEITLGTGQAGIAATIAGVAQRDALPARAVTVAYAAACRSRSCRTCPTATATRWGCSSSGRRRAGGRAATSRIRCTRRRSSSAPWPRFPDTSGCPSTRRRRPCSTAPTAWPTQRFQPMATHMTVAFTGQEPHAVWCWYSPKISGTARVRRRPPGPGADVRDAFHPRHRRIPG